MKNFAEPPEEYDTLTFGQSPLEWLRNRSNPAPTPEHRLVEGKNGLLYWADPPLPLRTNPNGKCHLHHRGNEVGYIDVGPKDDHLYIFDIVVYKAHQQQGLGTWLLNEAEQIAILNDLREIRGRLVRAGLENFHELPNWYEKNGYVVEWKHNANNLIGDTTIATIKKIVNKI